MKKRILSLFLAMVLLLGGCTGQPRQDPTESTAATTQPIDYWANVKAETAPVPAYNKEPLLAHDPNRVFYIDLINRDMDLYLLNSGFITFFLITREHYELDQIQIRAPLLSEHQIVIEDKTAHTLLGSDQDGWQIQYHHYLCMQNADWQELAQQAAYAQTAVRLNFESADPAIHEAYSAIAKECRAAYEYLMPQFNQLKAGDVPEFAVYSVKIEFTRDGQFYDEALESLEIILGEKTYTQDIGQIRIHDGYPQEMDLIFSESYKEGLNITQVSGGVINESPYTDGYTSLTDIIEFEAAENLTLTGLRQIGTQIPIVACKLQITDQPDHYWDMTRPVEVRKGDKVQISLYLKDDRFQQIHVGLTNYLALDYQLRNKSLCLFRRCALNRSSVRYLWDVYLMVFEGIDVGPYYDTYLRIENPDYIDLPPEILEKIE